MPTLSGLPDIWDLYQQMQPRGWSPPSGIEGSPDRNVITTGGLNWTPPGAPQPNLPEPAPPAPYTPGNGRNPMPNVGQYGMMNSMANQMSQMGKTQSYFPNVNPMAGTQSPFQGGTPMNPTRGSYNPFQGMGGLYSSFLGPVAATTGAFANLGYDDNQYNRR